MTVAAIADPDHCPDLTFITDTLNGQLRHLARQEQPEPLRSDD